MFISLTLKRGVLTLLDVAQLRARVLAWFDEEHACALLVGIAQN
jgi:hypothetical protein